MALHLFTRFCPPLMLFLLLAWVHPGQAQQPIGDYVCGDATKVAWFRKDIGGSMTAPCEAPLEKHRIPVGQVQAQRTVYLTVPQRHLKVVNGLMVMMTEEEKAVVEAAYLERERISIAWRDFLRDSPLCKSRSLEALSTQVTVLRQQALAAAAAGQLDQALTLLFELVEHAMKCEIATRRMG